jgi:hypothetical protein
MATLFFVRGRLLLGAVLWVGSVGGVAAQTVPDTTHLKYDEEVLPLSVGQVPLRVQQEQRGLWKLGLNNFLLSSTSFGPDSYYSRYGVHLAYERQLGSPAWSGLAEVSPALTRYRAEFSPDSRQSFSVRTQVAGALLLQPRASAAPGP